jgi:flagellar basal-body rod protein FlgF
MERGLYIAASGMLAELARQDQIASDLANVSTVAYKPERTSVASFGRMLLVERPSGRAVGSLGLGVAALAGRPDLAQGPLRETGEPLDVAIEGEGFLAVRTAAGTRYTRAGQLRLDGHGRLVTAAGDPVLDERGQPVLLSSPRPRIAADGSVSVEGRVVARLGLVSLRDPVKEGEGLYRGSPGPRPPETAIRQGFLEGSSVDPARAMVDMVVSLRAFEAMQRVIRAIDDTLGRGINGVQA